MKPRSPSTLTPETFLSGLRVLSRRDRDLRAILDRFGPPPMWSREPGFPTLLYIVLEQQVSLASAKAAYERLLTLASPLTPERFLEFDDATLKAVGFSRQKTGYGRHLAEAIIAGRVSLHALETMEDKAAKAELVRLKGIGSWTADIYLLMALRRPDIWPTGDLALATAVQQVKRRPSRLTTEALEAIGRPWKPWRAVAARILWHYYLSRRARE